MTAQQAAIPAPKPVELLAVAGIEGTELALDGSGSEEPLV